MRRLDSNISDRIEKSKQPYKINYKKIYQCNYNFAKLLKQRGEFNNKKKEVIKIFLYTF